jgi:hypothetical protein
MDLLTKKKGPRRSKQHGAQSHQHSHDDSRERWLPRLLGHRRHLQCNHTHPCKPRSADQHQLSLKRRRHGERNAAKHKRQGTTLSHTSAPLAYARENARSNRYSSAHAPCGPYSATAAAAWKKKKKLKPNFKKRKPSGRLECCACSVRVHP